MTMTIDLFTDTACPWCRIGKKYLFKALAEWQGEPIEVKFRSYFLQPEIQPGGLDFRTNMARMKGGEATLNRMFASVEQAGKLAGLHFDFSRVTRMPYPYPSHQAIALAPNELKGALIDALTEAYFERNEDVGDPDVVERLAHAAGVEGDIAAKIRAGQQLEHIQEDDAFAREIGIDGVPFFLINNKYGFSGARPKADILSVLEQIANQNVPE